MHVYVLNNGQRQGPYLIFKIKEMIDRGELTPTSLGWHDGADSWQPLRELPALSTLLAASATAGVADDVDDGPPPLPEMVANTARPAQGWRPSSAGTMADFEETEARSFSRGELFRTQALPRFCARAIDDILLFSLVIGLAIYDGKAALHDFVAPPNLFIFPAISFLGVVIESWLISRFGTTFGKWLMALRVVGDDGLPPDFSTALGRTLSVWFRGWGLGFGALLITVSSTIQGFLFLRHGVTPWDHIKNTRVQHTGLRWWRVVIFVLLTFVFWLIKSHVFWNAPIPENWPKEKKEFHQQLRNIMLQNLQQPTLPTRDLKQAANHALRSVSV
jgi:uncharacterized RDD family membrane protein YckC